MKQPAAVLVLYDGRPADPDRFFRYYRERHLPLVARFPGIRSIELERCVEGDVFMVARFRFDSVEAARAALASPERAVARSDMEQNFSPFEGRIRHQIVEIFNLSSGEPEGGSGKP